MSKKHTNNGSTWELLYEYKGHKFETRPKDTPEQIAAAIQTIHALADGVSAPRLVNSTHPLKPVIERAMLNVGATDFAHDNVDAVWADMQKIADSPGEYRHLLIGCNIDGSIQYMARDVSEGSDGHDIFTRALLRQLFYRQRQKSGE